MKKCSYCGRENEGSHLKCAGCGEPLPPSVSPQPEVGVAESPATPTPHQLHAEKLEREETEFAQKFQAATPRVWVTYGLIGVNCLIFLLMGLISSNLVQPHLGSLLDAGANWGPLTATNDGWWRLLANCFLHFTFWHLLGNMFALWQAGLLAERLFGNWFYLAIYAGAGLTSSLTALDWHPDVISAGASGAVFGVYGALLGYLVRQRGAVPRRIWSSLGKTILAFVAFNLFYGLTQLKVDNAAHEGGLLAGLIMGWVAARPLHLTHRQLSTGRTALQLTLSLLVMVLPLVWLIPHGRPGYSKLLDDMGTHFAVGSGEPKDRVAAIRWYLRAVRLGSSEAEFNLGRIYFNDDPAGSKNPALGIHWFQQAADHGSTNAEAALGTIYYNGDGIPEDHVEARHWIARAAQHGMVSEQVLLGLMYYKGDGAARDLTEAFHWIHQAAELGFPPAQTLLSALYCQGEGTGKDFAAAAHWALLAASHGQVNAQYELGTFYATGQGVLKDDAEAFAWLGLAVGNQIELTAQAKQLQAQLAGEMTPEQLARANRRLEELTRTLGLVKGAGHTGQ